MNPPNRPEDSATPASTAPREPGGENGEGIVGSGPRVPVPGFVQMRLFPAPQPLVDRLGTDFFRALPNTPGVYRMFDGDGRLLYVGKAKNLRSRLNSYRRTQGQSRKTVRLIHEARRVEWEPCASEVEARLRENHLIRTLRPRFNRAGVWPASARYIRHQTDGRAIALTMVENHEGLCFGAFRGGVGEALLALGRLMWLAMRPGSRPVDLPHTLVAADRLRHLEIPADAWTGIDTEVREYLAGEGDRLVARLIDVVTAPATPFEESLVALQFEVLQEFYRRGPIRNTELRRVFAIDRTILKPEEHDDLLVRWSEFAGERIPGLTTTNGGG